MALPGAVRVLVMVLLLRWRRILALYSQALESTVNRIEEDLVIVVQRQ